MKKKRLKNKINNRTQRGLSTKAKSLLRSYKYLRSFKNERSDKEKRLYNRRVEEISVRKRGPFRFTRQVNNDRTQQTSIKQVSEKYYRDINNVDPARDRKRTVCYRRKERREILFASGGAGKGRKVSPIRRMTQDSKIKC